MIKIVYHIKHNELKHLISCRKKNTVSTGEGKWFLVLRKSSYLNKHLCFEFKSIYKIIIKTF